MQKRVGVLQQRSPYDGEAARAKKTSRKPEGCDKRAQKGGWRTPSQAHGPIFHRRRRPRPERIGHGHPPAFPSSRRRMMRRQGPSQRVPSPERRGGRRGNRNRPRATVSSRGGPRTSPTTTTATTTGEIIGAWYLEVQCRMARLSNYLGSVNNR